MKIVVIGGTGLIGSKVVRMLKDRGHNAFAASPGTGVNIVTGEGLDAVLKGAEIVVDVANSPSFEADPAMAFFKSAGTNLMTAERHAGVKHHVALSVVGVDRLPDIPYFRAKHAQEKLIEGGGIPYSIVRATQFCEFVGAVAESGARDDGLHVTSAMMQPIAAEDVATALADVALATPTDRIMELAGPEPLRMDELARRLLEARGDGRQVVSDDGAPYFGMVLKPQSLLPGPNPRLAPTHFTDWLNRNVREVHPIAG